MRRGIQSAFVLMVCSGAVGVAPALADDVFDGRASFEPAVRPGDRSVDTVIVRSADGAAPAAVEAAFARAGVVETVRVFNLVPGLRVVRVAPGNVDAAIKSLAGDAAIRYAEADYLVSAQAQTTEYGITHVGAPAVWAAVAGAAGRGGGVRIAVLDTGVDLTHPDLPVPVQAESFVPGQAVDDLHTHGTHCSGLVLARDNDIGVVGVAPDALLMIGKVLGNSGSGNTSWVMAGNEWAAQNGAKVISMSLGGGGFSQGQQDLQNAIRAMGVIVFAAAGNDNSGELFYPASYDSVVSVAAIDSGYNRAGFSNFGPTVDLCAPGVANLSTIPQITTNADWASSAHGARLLSGSNFTGTLTANAVYCGFGGDAADFPPSVAGNIAHMRRRGTDAQGNTLSFRTKTDNAIAAGAIGVIISNDSGGVFSGNLNASYNIPVVSISQGDGDNLQNVNNNTSVTITVAQTGHTYASFSGTSMACPHAAGVAGLMIGIYGAALSPNALEDALKAAAQDLGDTGRDDLFGFGLVRADQTKAYLDINLPDCPVDYNNDGFLEPGDLDEFITDYFSVPVGVSSDFNGDGFVEPGDLDEFITRYFDGC